MKTTLFGTSWLLLNTMLALAESLWVTSETPLPADGIRITSLGTGARSDSMRMWHAQALKEVSMPEIIISLRIGTPNVLKEQVGTSILLELADGQVFLFDIGTGAYVNAKAAGLPASKLDKVFISHGHSDHLSDLPALFVGYVFGRTAPLHVWGPSGEAPEFGIKAAVEGLRQFLAWDTISRGRINLVTRSDEGPTIIAHEFDYSVKNQVVYHEKGVKITSTPVDHYHTPGAVAYRLEWNGITVTYSGDTVPIDSLAELAELGSGTDVLLLESVGPVEDILALPYDTQYLLNTSHITPKQAGFVISALKPAPRLAVVHHLDVNDATRVAIVTDIRAGYPTGALHIAEDMDVVDVTKESVSVRKRLYPTRSLGYFHAGAKGDADAAGDLESSKVEL